jgi:hypothetical protein
MPDRDLIAEGRRAAADSEHAIMSAAWLMRLLDELERVDADHCTTLGKLGVARGELTTAQGRIAELEGEQVAANKALNEIALRVRPDEDGTWTDRDGLLESIGNTVESTGRKVWEVSD